MCMHGFGEAIDHAAHMGRAGFGDEFVSILESADTQRERVLAPGGA